MMSSGIGGRCGGWSVGLVAFLFCEVLVGQVTISEFLAANRFGLLDEDGEPSDWIELHNASPVPVNLAGWALSDEIDNPREWIFPAVDIAANGFLVVFASGKDRRDPASELHTNFGINADGEFLGLVTPNGVLASGFVPEFPEQLADSSFGHPMSVNGSFLVDGGSPARVLAPSGPEQDGVWTAPDFDDSTWTEATASLGFDLREEPAFAGRFETDVADIFYEKATSLYVRVPFEVSAVDSGAYRLQLQYDDAVVVWLNGREIARRNFSGTPRSRSRARTSREDAAALTVEGVVLENAADLLVEGRNVLAIQLMNRAATEPDALLWARIESADVVSIEDSDRFYEESTPGWPNGEGFEIITDPPSVSEASGAYPEGLMVEITRPAGASEVRYTLDGTVPTRVSPVYEGPILIEGPRVLSTRAYADGALPSATVTRSYVVLAEDVLDFSSNLPLLVCTTFGQAIGGNCGGGLYTPGHLMAFQPGEDGRTRLLDEPQLSETAGFRKRGSSTCGRPKFSFNVEVRDARGEDKDVQLLNFASESDYVMYGPYNFDRALMRNPIAYWMSREVGRWAARTEFVECFYHPGGGPVTERSYFGVYVLMEKNKRGEDRIDVERLASNDIEEPEVAGGYILKRDRIGSGETSTTAGGYSSLVFVYPKSPAPEQRAFITQYINDAVNSLSPDVGSQEDAPLIDFMQWIDHHILNFYPKNVDAFRLSGYMHKTRSGAFAMGPVWDYDRAMGASDDGRARDPEGWTNSGDGDGGTQYFKAGGLGSWYSHLFNNREPTDESPWARAYRARWRELRAGPLRSVRIAERLDSWAEYLAEAAERNAERWREVRPTRGGGFQGEVEHLKNWLLTRADWIDSQFVEPPEFSVDGGLVEAGLEVGLSASEGEIFLTVNGPDPRGDDGEPHPAAVSYAGPVTITENTRIRARVRVDGGVWSTMVSRSYVLGFPTLAITELLFAPNRNPDLSFRPTDYEFIELYNFGDAPIDLAGVSATQPSRFRTMFTFPEDEEFLLGAGEYVVVGKNEEALRAQHPDRDFRVGVEFQGTASLFNSGQDLRLLGGVGETILDFEYDDVWQPLADTEGHSLVILDPNADRSTWADPNSWTASASAGGSPGGPDPAVTPGGLQRPGDVTQDGRVNLVDAIGVLDVLVGAAQGPCETTAGNTALLDGNGDGLADLSDAVYLLSYLFARGAPPVLGTSCTMIQGCQDSCSS